ncbi:PspC domain-containing protein [Natronogracilivirga saccharolytica]|nr:PspC domain-containing protein [Natronogracilivirga saccharolytica]
MERNKTGTHLKNDLDPDLRITDEEYERLKSEYEFEKGEKIKNKGSGFARAAGIVFLIAAAVFVMQQFYFPYGPDITHILRVMPAAGTILVILIGLGLLSSFRRRRKVSQKEKKSAAPNTSESDSGDSFAYQYNQKWYRSRQEKMIFGVCGGIAERFGWDPTIVRALFVLAFFSYGFSLVIYIALAVILPKRPVRGLVS